MRTCISKDGIVFRFMKKIGCGALYERIILNLNRFKRLIFIELLQY